MSKIVRIKKKEMKWSHLHQIVASYRKVLQTCVNINIVKIH